MAWTPPDPGRLRHRLRFQGRSETGENVGGVVMGDWVDLFDRRGELLPERGFEEVRAARAEGVSIWTLKIRGDSDTHGLKASHRVIDRDTGQAFDVRSVLPMTPARDWLLLTIEANTDDGKA